MSTVQAPITELPIDMQRWLAARLKSHAKLHFDSSAQMLSWCEERDLLSKGDDGRRSVRHSSPVQVYQAIRQIILELECPDVLREMSVMRRQLQELREENAFLQTTVAVLSGQLRSAKEDMEDELEGEEVDDF